MNTKFKNALVILSIGIVGLLGTSCSTKNLVNMYEDTVTAMRGITTEPDSVKMHEDTSTEMRKIDSEPPAWKSLPAVTIHLGIDATQTPTLRDGLPYFNGTAQQQRVGRKHHAPYGVFEGTTVFDKQPVVVVTENEITFLQIGRKHYAPYGVFEGQTIFDNPQRGLTTGFAPAAPPPTETGIDTTHKPVLQEKLPYFNHPTKQGPEGLMEQIRPRGYLFKI